MMEEALEGEDALSSYDPHNTGMYRGVNLNQGMEVSPLDLLEGHEEGPGNGGPVAFKKRKGFSGGGKGGMRKKKSREDD